MLNPNQLLVPFLRTLLPFLILTGLLLLGSYVWYLRRQRRLSAAGLPEIDRMTGKDFESRMAALFRSKGYRVEQTPYVGDWGADLILSKNGERTVAQIKRWNRKVSVRAVQEVVASKAKYGCTCALVATNALFTDAAVQLAEANGVELWDRHRLAEELLAGAASLKVAKSAPEASAIQSTPKCFKCGREMVLNENARGKFWACPGFPKCRNTFPARA